MFVESIKLHVMLDSFVILCLREGIKNSVIFMLCSSSDFVPKVYHIYFIENIGYRLYLLLSSFLKPMILTSVDIPCFC